MKLRKADYMFIIVYIILLIFLLFFTPVSVGGGTGSSEEISSPLWREITYLLVYIIGAPLIYLVLRRYLYPKKRTEQP
jgi:hypothetical protein